MLKAVGWRGDEAVLDIGTGWALLAIGAAKRLRTGTVTAIDILGASDPAKKGTLEDALRNAQLERVQDRIEFRSDDASDIGFIDHSFDVVLSLMGFHSLADAGSREAACHEVARVLKPHGIAIIADQSHAADYARALAAAGLKVIGPKSYFMHAYTTLAIVLARKL
jgi:ubiquinone/menaquinone biosynthesis C-methylase UbiE